MSQILIQFTQQLGETHFDISMVVPSRGITAIFGRSGAGKTSVINALSGLTTPSSGRIVVNDSTLFDSSKGINVPTHKRRVGYVFQESRLFPHYTVKGNLLYGVTKYDGVHFKQIVSLLDIDSLLNRYPASLSGGEKQRVAIGRALLSKPEILLMDEPLASLDLPRKREVMPFLEELADKVNIPVLYVSHSLHEILRLANHLVILEQGKVVTNGTIEEVWASQAMRPWQSFAEQSSLFDAQVAEHHAQYALSKVTLAPNVDLWVQKVGIDPAQKIRLQIRANDVSITKLRAQQTSIRNILPAVVTEIESDLADPNKQSVSVKLMLADHCQLWATITPWAMDDLELRVGDHVYAQIKGVSVTQRDIAQRHP